MQWALLLHKPNFQKPSFERFSIVHVKIVSKVGESEYNNTEIGVKAIILLVLSFTLPVTHWIIWIVNNSKTVVFKAHVWKLNWKIKNKRALNM